MADKIQNLVRHGQCFASKIFVVESYSALCQQCKLWNYNYPVLIQLVVCCNIVMNCSIVMVLALSSAAVKDNFTGKYKVERLYLKDRTWCLSLY